MFDDEVPAPIGDNSGEFPLPTVDEIISKLEVNHAAALERVNELLEKGQKHLVITDDAGEEAATEFLVPIRSRFKQSEADRVAAKTPWDDRAGAVQAFFKGRILDLLGRAPDNTKEIFDPLERVELGIGPRINMAMTLYKRDKVERERKAREAEAARLREVERQAAEKRRQEEAERRRKEDAERAERDRIERERRAEEDRIAQAARAEADRLAKEARDAEAAAARKRNADSVETANKEAERIRKAAAEQAERQRLIDEQTARERAERDRQDRERQERERADQEERDRISREEENRLAAERAEAEHAASASAADLSRSRGGKAGVASLREFVDVRDIDRDNLDYAAIGPYLADKVVKSALDDYAKAHKATVMTGIKTGTQPVRGAIFFINSRNAGRA